MSVFIAEKICDDVYKPVVLSELSSLFGLCCPSSHAVFI